MSTPCPDALVLRILAEAEGEVGESNARLLQHVGACADCRAIVELARREEAVLRAQLAVDFPAELRDSLHQSTLRALDEHPPRSASRPAAFEPARRPTSSRRVRVGAWRARDAATRSAPDRAGPGVLAISLALLGASALAVVGVSHQLAQPDARPENAPARTPAEPNPADRKPDPAGAIAAPRSDTTTVQPPRDGEPADPGPIAKAGETPAPPRSPDDAPAADDRPEVAGAPGPTASPDVERPASERVLAFFRSGKLSTGGKALSAGDPLPEGASFEVASTTEVESVGAARLVLASGTKLSVKKGESGEPVFVLGEGKLLASSSGSKPYAVASADVRAIPARASARAQFLFSVDSERTRLSTLEGRVSAQVERLPLASAVALDVRSGFEADLVKGKLPEAPRPFAAARAVSWLPESARPKALPPTPRLVSSFSFEDGEAWNVGTLVAGGARGSKHALKGVALGDWTAVELTDERASSLELTPALWVELACKVDKTATVALEFRGKKREHGPRDPNRDPSGRDEPLLFGLRQRVEPGAWVTIAAPIRDFATGPEWGGHPGRGHAGAPSPKSDERVGRFVVRALSKGEVIDLLVDDVRFFAEDGRE